MPNAGFRRSDRRSGRSEPAGPAERWASWGDLRYVPVFPYAEHALELARSGYENQNVEIATVLSAQREVLQVEIQVAQVEAEPGKALASLERAVGGQVNDRAPE